ncbi:hypothetical protein F4860DRAFT_503352 [Xylaria cubensis]|nr:hypothetical protein F4860DRAFT_503352 [Xylaria cubensis]
MSGVVCTENSTADLRYLLTSVTNRWAANTTVAFPGDGDKFTDVTERWTVFKPPTYVAAVSPGTENDVVKVVKLAASHGFQFLATGGRHGYGTTLGNLQNGVEIDLSRLNKVSINKSAGTMTIGGGTTFADVVHPVYEAGFQTPTGSCSCPGMVGVTIGAGVGRSSGVFGLVQDSLISARLVLADGRLIEVSEKSNSDLFWGVRGAGANFGIITSATYRLHPQINNGQAVNLDFMFPLDSASAYFDVLESYNNSLPPELSSATVILYDGTSNSTTVLANWVYLGSEEKARALLAPLFKIRAIKTAITVVPWSEILAVAGFNIDPLLCETGKIRAIYSTNVRNISASTYTNVLNKMDSFYQQYPNARESVIQLEIYPNQKTLSVSSNFTAYPWRDALGNMIINFSWLERNQTTAAAVQKLALDIRKNFVDTSGYPGLSVYVNYAYGDEAPDQIYGKDNLPRLERLKEIWDPDHVFRYSNELPGRRP